MHKNLPIKTDSIMNHWTFLFCLILISVKSFSQTGIDSILGNYLKSKSEIDSVQYQVIPKKNGYDLISNFYVTRVDSVNIKNDVVLVVKFGSYTTHLRPHIALFIKSNIYQYKILNGLDLKTDILSFFDFTNTLSYPKKEFNIKQYLLLKDVLKIYPIDW